MPALGLDVILLGLGISSEFVLQHLHHALENYWARHYEPLFTLYGITAQEVAHNGVCI
jgi:hypothetical protein